MQETSTSPTPILQFRQDIEAQFRRHIREALDVALGLYKEAFDLFRWNPPDHLFLDIRREMSGG